MVTYGLPAALAPYVAEGLIGLSWTDQQQESDATLFLVQQGRLYVAGRFDRAQHLALNGVEEASWTPFRVGDPEAQPPSPARISEGHGARVCSPCFAAARRLRGGSGCGAAW